MWVCSSRPLDLHFAPAWDCCQQDAVDLADQHGDSKVRWNYKRISCPLRLTFPWGNENECPRELKTSRWPEIKLLQWTVTLISLHSQWNESQYRALEDCDCAHWLDCFVSLNLVRIKPIDVFFLIFAHRSHCLQCHDSVAGPDVGQSAAGAAFLFYHSNFVVHQLELKACKNCCNCLAHFSSWEPRPHTTSTLPRIHIDDFVHLPNDPNWSIILMMRHTCSWHLTMSLSDYTENCLLPVILENKRMSVTVYSP